MSQHIDILPAVQYEVTFMARFGLSKSKIISGLQCPKRLYLEVHHPELAEVSDETERMFSNGHLVGEIARNQQPSGKLVSHTDDLKGALAETQALLKAEPKTILFEATFEHGGVLIRADILSRNRSKAQLVEVKSSTSVKGYHYNDAAIQYWVVTGAGIPLSSVSIAHIDNQFVYPGDGDYRGLLTQVNVTEEILPLTEQVPVWVKDLKKVLAGDTPEISMGKQCHDPFECPFQAFCSKGKEQSEYPVEILPNGGKVVARLVAEGYSDLRDVPMEKLSSAKHLRVWRASKSGKPELDSGIRNLLRSLPFPRFYFDFETIQFAVPIWSGTRPYEQLPFQWSCHIEEESGELRHEEFLDTSGNAPMRLATERLIATLGKKGPILTYGHFESTRLKALAERFPDLSESLTKISRRTMNLHPIVKDHYYHPAMKGSWSLKDVLPTVAPDLRYGDLGEVQEGGAAQGAYLSIIDPATPEARRKTLTRDLLDYCGMDTMGLVRAVKFFAER